MKIIVVAEFLAGSSAPTGDLVSDFIDYARESGQAKFVTIIAPGRYIPGGLGPRRIRNLIWINSTLFLKSLWHRLFSFAKREPIGIFVTTAPPAIQWSAFIVGFVLRIPVVMWFQDSHPEVEARIIEVKGYHRSAAFLRWLDRKLMPLCKAVTCLDESMRDDLLARTGYEGPIEITYPWATYLEPAHPFRAKSSSEKYSLLYAGNYGTAHDLSPLAIEVAKLSIEEQRRYKFTFVGMSPKAQAHLKELFAGLASNVELLPRFATIDGLFAKYIESDFGIVCLRKDYSGIVCPSKAFTYLSQGLPLFYVGPENSMSWNLCKRGWGYTMEDWFGLTRDEARDRIAPNIGKTFPNPKARSRDEVMQLLLRTI